jgi:5-dehydro-2-deoxygluconokinase
VNFSAAMISKRKALLMHDSIHMGRSCLDLYSNDIGAPFAEISNFAAYVGGSPTNICVGAQRLGLKTALLTAVGKDPVGEFVLRFLKKEGIDTSYIPEKPDRRTSAVALGIEPPDRFPLVYYRENCADAALTIDDVDACPIKDAKIFQFAGTNLSVEPSRTATLYAAEVAKRAGATVVFDLDFRSDQWPDPRSFGIAVRSSLRSVDIVLGTADEIRASMLTDTDSVQVTHSQVSDAHISGDVEAAIPDLLGMGPRAVVEKIGAEGARVHELEKRTITATDAPGFPVDIVNVLGAGDAFGAGFIHGIVNDWELVRAARFGNACGAIVVTQHGCSSFMPTQTEVNDFVQARGGL